MVYVFCRMKISGLVGGLPLQNYLLIHHYNRTLELQMLVCLLACLFIFMCLSYVFGFFACAVHLNSSTFFLACIEDLGSLLDLFEYLYTSVNLLSIFENFFGSAQNYCKSWVNAK